MYIQRFQFIKAFVLTTVTSEIYKMTDTDALKFKSLTIFDSVKDYLPDGVREICDIKEDLLFVWNYSDCNLLVVNWRSAQSSDASTVKTQVNK